MVQCFYFFFLCTFTATRIFYLNTYTEIAVKLLMKVGRIVGRESQGLHVEIQSHCSLATESVCLFFTKLEVFRTEIFWLYLCIFA